FIVEPKLNRTETDYFSWNYPEIKLKYGECSESECLDNADLFCTFYYSGNPHFTIKETEECCHIYLDSDVTTYREKTTCPSY
ncbi:uncharacterized protein DAT39_018660, partial [Clarias magur]